MLATDLRAEYAELRGKVWFGGNRWLGLTTGSGLMVRFVLVGKGR